jgi:uncharacterized protein (DUF1800 family)
MVVWDEENAAHLLSRAGFGSDPKESAKYAKLPQSFAVDLLVNVKESTTRGPGKSGADATDADDRAALKAWWAKRMVKARSRRLQEKMCLFWHDHFASSLSVVKNNLYMAMQNATFRYVGLGSFHTLVFEITRDPAMLDFLDLKLSTKTKPNENYGRELMELFVLGVKDLLGVDNYTQDDVEQITKALTGWQIVNDVGSFTDSRHDHGNKTLFAGKSYQAGPADLGVVDPAGVLLAPSTNVIDALFAHRDSTGALTMPRFLGKKLWEWFAYPNPSTTLVDEITAAFIANPSGDPKGFVIRDLLRSIFMHDEFYSAQAKTSSVKNPCEFVFHAIRATKSKTNGNVLPDHLEAMGMDLFDPPGVNGWNHGLPWMASGLFLARIKFAQALAAGRTSDLKLTPTKVIDRNATNAADVTDEILAKLGMTAYVPAGARQALIDYFEGATSFVDVDTLERKVRGAIMLALSLPEFQVH